MIIESKICEIGTVLSFNSACQFDISNLSYFSPISGTPYIYMCNKI